MKTFFVTVTNPRRSAGVGPIKLQAESEYAVHDAFYIAAEETAESLERSGLTVWEIVPVVPSSSV